MSTRRSIARLAMVVLVLGVGAVAAGAGCGAPADISLGPAGEPSGSRAATRLSFTIDTDPAHAALAQAYRDLFAGFGLSVRVEVMPWDQVLGRALSGESDASILGWAGYTAEPLEMAAVKLAGSGVANGSGYANPEIDLLLSGLLTRAGAGERAILAREARELLYEEAPWVVGVTWSWYDISSSRLVGWTPGAAGAVALHDATYAPGAAPADERPLVVALGVSRLPAIDPLRPIDPQCGALYRALFDGLTARGPDGALLPELAESWEFSPGGRRLRVVLREGVLFHDGSPLRARDVVFTYRQSLPGRLPPGVAVGVEAIGTREVLFSFSTPFPEFLELHGGQPVVPAAVYEAVGREAFGLAPVGTGPYLWPDSGPGAGAARVTLAAWPQYYGGAPELPPARAARLPAVTFAAVADVEDRLAMLAQGEADLVPVVPAARALAVGIEGAPRVLREPGHSIAVLELNNRRAPFDDARVRLALNHMVDPWVLGAGRDPGVELMATLWEPYCDEGTDTPGVWSFDPALARELLADAGYQVTGP